MTTSTTETFAEIGIPSNPFPGLRPFDFDESPLFFGRDGQSERLIDKLGHTRFLAVVGTSGSGKSSLVRAGLLPALLGGFMTGAGSDWRIAILRPGNDPIGRLAAALNERDVFGSDDDENQALQIAITEATLRRGNRGLVDVVRQNAMPDQENLLVVVDQFEELFRFAREASRKTREEGERFQNDAAAFIKLLLEAHSQREVNIYVVLTMRSDFLGDCSQFWGLPEAINESQYLIPRLTRDQLREAITAPVAVAGGRMTPRLVNRLLNDVGDDQDQLPVLQHLLMRVWNEWKEKRLDIEFNDRGWQVRRPHKEVHEGAAIDLCCYEAVGGMNEALSLHADEAYDELSASQRKLTEWIFKCLTEKGPDNREVRRPLTVSELCAITEASESEVLAVIEAFRKPGRSFLMPPAEVKLNGESLIDISHESLIRKWKGASEPEEKMRLCEWVDDEARCARDYRRLAETAALYQAGQAAFWRDPDLQNALNWRERVRPNHAWARRYDPNFEEAMAFLEASRAARDAEVREKQERRQKEIRRARIVTIVFAGLFLVALGAGFFAWTKAAQARSALKEVEKQREEATTQRNIAIRERGYAITREEDAKKAEQEALEQKQEAEKQGQLAVEQRTKAEQSARQASEQTKIARAETAKAETAEKHAVGLNYVATLNLAKKEFDIGNRPRGYELLEAYLPERATTGSDDLRDFAWYHLWELNHHERVTFKSGEFGSAVAFSPDGQTLVGVSSEAVKLWDVAKREELATAEGFSLRISVAFSPDGKMLAAAGGSLKLWDTATKQWTTLEDSSDIFDVAFSPDGKVLATAGGPLKLWNTSTKQWNMLDVTPVKAVAFSPDSKILASMSEENVARLWDLGSKPEFVTLKRKETSTRANNRLAFSPNGRTLAIVTIDQIELWDVNTKKQLSGFDGPFSLTAVFSPDGLILAAADGIEIVLWDMRTMQELARLKGHANDVNHLAFSPDGKTLASSSYDCRVRLWDITTKKTLAELKGHAASVAAAAFSPDGKTLASSSDDGTIKLWDMDPKLGSAPEHYPKWEFIDLELPEQDVSASTFSRDGKLLASGREDGTVKLWDINAKKDLAMLERHKDRVTIVEFSPDGKTLASGSIEGMVILWDVRTKEKLATFEGPDSPLDFPSVAFSPDGRTLAYVNERVVKLWDVNTKQESTPLEGQFRALEVVFSPDGKTLAMANPNEIMLWNVITKRQIKRFRETAFSSALTFSPDGKMLAWGDSEWNVRLLNIATLELATLRGHRDFVFSIAFSPDGKTLASANKDRSVKLWHLATRQELTTFWHSEEVLSVAFFSDGKKLAAVGTDNQVRLWVAATDQKVAAQRGK